MIIVSRRRLMKRGDPHVLDQTAWEPLGRIATIGNGERGP